MENYLKTALDKVLTYETPPAIVKYMEMQSAIGNPPWKKEGKEEWIALFYLNGFDFLQNATDVCSWGMIFKKID